MIDENLRLDNYEYILNKKSIANYPCEKREESKLLVYKNRKIKSVKFFEKLEARVISLKWRDVRVIFGKEAETA